MRPKIERNARTAFDRVLIRHGLLRGPGFRVSGGSGEPSERLRSALTELGPEATLFGRYLSTRLDLVPFETALSLRRLPLLAPDMSPHIDRGLKDRLAIVDPKPHAAGFCWLAYRGLTADGRAVEARCLDVEAVERVGDRIEALRESLSRALADSSWSLPMDRLWSGFVRDDWRRRLDSSMQAAAWRRLAHEAEAVDGLVTPKVDVDLSSEGVLILELPALARPEATPEGQRRFHEKALPRKATAAWLQLALTAGIFPVNGRWALAEDGRIVLLDGTFAELSAHQRPRAWDFLRAVSRQDPDRALRALVRGLDAPRGWEPGTELRALQTNLRYVVPFRDGSWTRAGDSLAETATHHWRAFVEHGFEVPEGWGGFFRALILRSFECSDQDPRRDALKEALEGLQWQAGWNQLRQLTDPAEMVQSAERRVLGLLELPQALDHLLDLSDPAQEFDGEHRSVPRRPERPRWIDSYGAVTGAVLGLIAAILVSSGVMERYPELEGVVLFWIGVLGVLTLGLILRQRRAP